MELMKLLILAALLAIVVSMATAVYHLSSKKGNRDRMVRALTIRMGISVALFILLLVAWKLGYIRPHGV